MTEEELRRKLKEAGIPVGEPWSQSTERTAKSPLIEQQKKTLRKLEGLVERQIEEDQQRVAELHAALVRLKHGGAV